MLKAEEEKLFKRMNKRNRKMSRPVLIGYDEKKERKLDIKIDKMKSLIK